MEDHGSYRIMDHGGSWIMENHGSCRITDHGGSWRIIDHGKWVMENVDHGSQGLDRGFLPLLMEHLIKHVILRKPPLEHSHLTNHAGAEVLRIRSTPVKSGPVLVEVVRLDVPE
jgi:hypothetical protein